MIYARCAPCHYLSNNIMMLVAWARMSIGSLKKKYSEAFRLEICRNRTNSEVNHALTRHINYCFHNVIFYGRIRGTEKYRKRGREKERQNEGIEEKDQGKHNFESLFNFRFTFIHISCSMIKSYCFSSLFPHHAFFPK